MPVQSPQRRPGLGRRRPQELSAGGGQLFAQGPLCIGMFNECPSDGNVNRVTKESLSAGDKQKVIFFPRILRFLEVL